MSADFVANFGCERAWAGAAAPSARARARAATLAPWAAALAPDDVEHVTVWLEADPRSPWIDRPGLPRVTPRVGDGPVAATSWGARGDTARDGTGPTWRSAAWSARGSRSIAATVGARPWAHQLAITSGIERPPAFVVRDLDALREATRTLGPWVAKAAYSAAGRDRVWGDGEVDAPTQARAADLLRWAGSLLLEPWLERVADAATCGVVATDTEILLLPTHGLRSGPRGQFLGIDRSPSLDALEVTRATAVAREVGLALAREGFRGPFGVDALVYTDATGARRLHPIVEVNPRYTFGHVAHALAERGGGAPFVAAVHEPEPRARRAP